MLSGGRDRKIFMTDLRCSDRRVLVCEESEPVLKMILTPDQTGIWVATSASAIKLWVSLMPEKAQFPMISVIMVLLTSL